MRLLKALGISILLLASVGMLSILYDLFMLIEYQGRLAFGVGVAFGCLVAFNYFLVWLFEVYQTDDDHKRL